MKKIIFLQIVLTAALNASAQTMATGWNHSLAICSDSTAWAWGYNHEFVLGNGTNVDSNVPVPVSLLTGVVAIDGGNNYSLALKSDGTVWSWGWNQYGELGNGIPADTNEIPMQVNALSGITAISAVGSHSLALKNDGTVWAWGYNVNGELGNGITSDTNNLAMQVPGLSGVTAIATGGHHSLALKSDSTVWAWGSNGIGQLGIGTIIDSYVPVQVIGLTGVIAIAGAGETNSLALKSDGTVWAWGWNNYGQLGDGTNAASSVPVQVTGLTGMIAINGGTYHSLAVKNDGTAWAWGWNGYGQLGNGTMIDTNLAVQVTGLTGITAISGGSGFSVAQKSDGSGWAWGSDGYGQLGDGGFANSSIPVRVRALCCVPVTSTQTLNVCAGESVTVGSNVYSSSNTYTDTLTIFSTGCDSVVTTILNVAAPINDSVFSMYPTCACPGQLVAYDTAATSFLWLDCNNGMAPIAGATNQVFPILFTGDYAVVVTEGSCVDTSDCIYGIATGIDEYSKKDFQIYPNPNNGRFVIKADQESVYSVRNSLGQIMETFQLKKLENYQVDISNLGNGIYFISNEEGLQKRVIVLKE